MKHTASLLASLLIMCGAPGRIAGAQARAKEPAPGYDVLTSAEFKQALKDNKVVLVTYRDIQKPMYPAP